MSAGIFSVNVAKKHICIYRAYLRFLANAKKNSQGEACGQQRVEANISNLDEKILLSVLLPDLSIPFFYVNIGVFFLSEKARPSN